MEAGASPIPTGPPQRGFFESLMDTHFNSLITPKLIRFLYIVGMIVLAVGAFVWIIVGFSHNGKTGVLSLILAPIAALVYLIVLRLYLELVVVAFKIRDATEETAINTRPRAQ